MNDTIEIIKVLAPVICTAFVAYLAYRERIASQERMEMKAATREVAAKVEEVHIATNGMKDRLMEVTAKAAHAEGKEQERTEERDRTSSVVVPEQKVEVMEVEHMVVDRTSKPVKPSPP